VLVGGALVCGGARLAAQTTLVAPGPEAVSASVVDGAAAAVAPAAFAATDAGGGGASRRKQLIIWGSILAGTYVATIVGDTVNQGLDFPETFIPVAGPFIALARYDDVVGPDYEYSSGDKALFLASGIVQTVAAAFLVKALVSGKGKDAGSLKHVPAISVVPTGRRGFRVSCQLRF
jgi:hypothetical protein